MPRLARDEQAALTATVVGILLLAHGWLLRALARWVQQLDDDRPEID